MTHDSWVNIQERNKMMYYIYRYGQYLGKIEADSEVSAIQRFAISVGWHDVSGITAWTVEDILAREG